MDQTIGKGILAAFRFVAIYEIETTLSDTKNNILNSKKKNASKSLFQFATVIAHQKDPSVPILFCSNFWYIIHNYEGTSPCSTKALIICSDVVIDPKIPPCAIIISSAIL